MPGRINIGRAVAGGLLAGLVINIGETILNAGLMAPQLESAMRARNLPPVAGEAIAGFVVLGFALGVMAVWLYAAIRTRFGAGPKTAALAGAVVWFFAHLYPSASMMVMHMFPRRMLAMGVLWGLFEIVIATIAGASVYRE